MTPLFNFLVNFNAQYVYVQFDTTPSRGQNQHSEPMHRLLKISPSAQDPGQLSIDLVEKKLEQSKKKEKDLLEAINYLFNFAVQSGIIHRSRPHEFAITFIKCLPLKSKVITILETSNMYSVLQNGSLITDVSGQARGSNKLWHLLHQKTASVPLNQNDLKSMQEYVFKVPYKLLRKIGAYHNIPKTKFEFLSHRIAALWEICKDCLFSVQSVSESLALNDLFVCSAGKYNYLRSLFCSLRFFRKKKLFKSFLERYMAPPFRTHLISRHMPNASHQRQALDPYMSDSQEIHDFFKKWEELSHLENRAPFFLWLEQFNRSDRPMNRVKTPQELECYKLEFRDSLIYQNGTLLNIECADFVVDFKGNFYVSKEIKHFGFFNGKPVTGAGELNVTNGKITLINDNSGHYQPRIIHTLQTLKLLDLVRVFADDAIVSYTDTQKIIDQQKPFFTRISVKSFLEDPPFEPNGIVSIFNAGQIELCQLNRNEKWGDRGKLHP